MTEFSVLILFQVIYSFRKQLARGHFFEGLQNYMENKNKGNEHKIILGYFLCTMDKMNRDGRNKTERVYKCRSNYALSKFIVDNGPEDLWRTENPDSSEFTHFDKSVDTRSRIDRLSSKTKTRKYSRYFNNSLLWMPELSTSTENLLKTWKKITLRQVTGGNSTNFVLKKKQGDFLKIPSPKKILEFNEWTKTLQSLYKKENFKPETKPMIKNLQEKLYQLDKKQKRGLNFMLTSDGSWESKML